MISEERINEIGEPFGYFHNGDSQGDKRLAFARAIEAEVAAPLEATIAQQAERIKELIAIDKERAAQLFEGMGKTLALEKQLTAANALIEQLGDDLSAARAEIARLKMYEPGNRAKAMDKPVQVAATKLSYWGIIDKEEAEA